LDPRHLRSFLDRRVRDGVIRRTIDKWLKAGVFEEGRVHHRTLGTPQGGVISPLLANLYLHEVVDRWFAETVQSHLEGRAVLIRYADDMVFVFELEHDARRVSEVLPKRLARYGLRLHPEKTRLLDFRRPRGGGPRGRGPRSFDFLGFTHHWGRSRHGRWVVKRKTAKGRLSRALRRIREWCSKHRHQPVWWQQQRLSQKLKGHYGYFGITGNRRALESFYWHVERIWRTWLNRRSQKARMIWSRFTRLLRRYPLAKPRIVHSYVNT
ncbi:MAG: reverse transcriptase domain-containing protein, partial [Acidobacteriota bacterium]